MHVIIVDFRLRFQAAIVLAAAQMCAQQPFYITLANLTVRKFPV